MRVLQGLTVAVSLLSGAFSAGGATLSIAEDSSSFGGRLTRLTNRAATLPVDSEHVAFLYFDISELPIASAREIRHARLRVYFPSVTAAGGGIRGHLVTTQWTEAAPGVAPKHETKPSFAIPAAFLRGRNFAGVDVTDALKAWLANEVINEGLALRAVGGAKLLIGAKEGSGSGYPAELEVELNPPAGGVAPEQLAPNLTLEGTTTGHFRGDGSALTGISAANLLGSIGNSQLANSTFRLSLGPGLAGESTVPLGGTLSLSNTGVLSLRGGSGVTVSAAHGHVTLGSTSAFLPAGSVPWESVSGVTVQAAANTGYLVTGAERTTIILPPQPAIGEIVQVTGVGAGGWTIAPATGQSTAGFPAGEGPSGGQGDHRKIQYVSPGQWQPLVDAEITARVNVKNYGARGDGVADDTLAIQAAVNSVRTRGSGEVYFPAGIYRCNIVVDGPARIALTGVKNCGGFDDFAVAVVDSSESVLRPWNPAAPVLAVRSPTGSEIKNLRLRGPGAYTAGSIGIQLAADATGRFAGTGARLSGVAINDFDINLLLATNRVIIEHCSFLGGSFNVLATGAFLPADTLTFIGCANGGAKLTEPDKREPNGSRTNTAYHLSGGLKGVSWIGCETGNCGTAFYLNGGLFTLQGSNIEGCDQANIVLADGRLSVVSSRVLNSNHPFADVRGANASASFVQSYSPAWPRSWGATRKVTHDPPYVVEYLLADGTARVGYAMSNGTFMGAQLTKRQVFPQGRAVSEVAFDALDTVDRVENDPSFSNYDPASGRWTCPVDGTYTFRVVLLLEKEADVGFVYLQERIGDRVIGDFSLATNEPASSGRLTSGEMTRSCFAGRSYSVAVHAGAPGALTIEPGTSPATGKPVSRLTITRED